VIIIAVAITITMIAKTTAVITKIAVKKTNAVATLI